MPKFLRICGDRWGCRADSDLTHSAVWRYEFSGAAPGERGATLDPMPTTKPRYTVTDTGDLSDQLDQAQRRWPEIKDRKALLLKLAAAGRDAIEEKAT